MCLFFLHVSADKDHHDEGKMEGLGRGWKSAWCLGAPCAALCAVVRFVRVCKALLVQRGLGRLKMKNEGPKKEHKQSSLTVKARRKGDQRAGM